MLQPLPIDAVLPALVDTLAGAGALVLTALPGAGKTTRVAPALLDGGLAELETGKPGLIIVLQPRRVAARAAAARIAEERGGRVGEEVGYQVRHERRLSAATRILVCTEGVFLRKLQEDPLLEHTAIVVFDEFHERNLDSDLSLSLLRQVRRELRPDLKIVVMSATLDADPVCRFLDNCPHIDSPGRAYPVKIEYLTQPKAALDEACAEGVKRMLKASRGHVLAFLPGVGEIRKTGERLKALAEQEELALLELYGDLPLEEQQRVLKDVGQRKVVLATNVAETSITISGVTAVVDSGLARVNRLDPQLGLNRLSLERISRAAADQRAGRAGRTEGGTCLRLWSEREHPVLPAFAAPEIARVELSECALQLLSWGEKDLEKFAWFEAPSPVSLSRALELLDRLDALRNGSLTDLGRQMAALPLQPRLARLLLEGVKCGQRRRASLCAALLSERDPIDRRSFEREVVRHKSESDVLDRIWTLEEFASKGERHTFIGELMVGPARQILRAAEQLERLLPERLADRGGTAGGEADEAIARAILAAFPDRVCRRRESGGRRALMVGGRGVKLASPSAVTESELFVAVELLETGQSEASVRQASAINKSWLPESHLVTNVDVVYDAAREKVVAFKRTRFCDLIIDESITSLPPELDAGAVLARGLSASIDLSALVDEEARQFLARLACLRECMPESDLPEFSAEPWLDLLPQWCMGCTSLAELKASSFLAVLKSVLTHKQLMLVDSEVPERLAVPSGNSIKLHYEEGKPPVLAVRIQEVFGMTETPRLAGGRLPVLMHLLAPNYRVQQITPDLASFWKNTYGEVKKDLKARYPKHAWPDNPLTAQAERGPRRR